MNVDAIRTRAVQTRYNRIASVYDLMEGLMERQFVKWRPCAWSLVKGESVLEVGIGTGQNMPYHPQNMKITGIDFSDKMLARAVGRLAALGRSADLKQMDAQAMTFPDHSFDSAIATCVFCSGPDPVLGLSEVRRVVKPGGSVILLEHGRGKSAFMNRLLDLLAPLIRPADGSAHQPRHARQRAPSRIRGRSGRNPGRHGHVQIGCRPRLIFISAHALSSWAACRKPASNSALQPREQK